MATSPASWKEFPWPRSMPSSVHRLLEPELRLSRMAFGARAGPRKYEEFESNGIPRREIVFSDKAPGSGPPIALRLSCQTNLLPLHQFNPAVLGSPSFGFIGCDRCIDATAECVQTASHYAVLAGQFSCDTGGSPPA